MFEKATIYVRKSDNVLMADCYSIQKQFNASLVKSDILNFVKDPHYQIPKFTVEPVIRPPANFSCNTDNKSAVLKN